MVKRILLGAAFLGVIGLLIVGAMNRTNSTIGGTSYGRGQGQGYSSNIAQSGAVNWTTVEGLVINVDSAAMTVKSATGELVYVENRPWSYALDQQFSAQVGDLVRISGFSESGSFSAAQVQNVTNGKIVQLRDETGRPGWSGRGRGNNGG
jgi:hypothetical protein